MMKKLNHLGIAVSCLEEATDHYRKLLGIEPSCVEELPERGVRVSIFRLEEIEIELFEPLGREGESIRRFLSKRGEGFHHLCLEVDDIEAELDRLNQEGFMPLGSIGKGAQGRRIAFLRPARGVLIELSEKAIEK